MAVSVRREVAGGVVIKWQRSDNAQKMNPLAGKGGSAPPDIDLSNVQPLVITNTARSPPDIQVQSLKPPQLENANIIAQVAF